MNECRADEYEHELKKVAEQLRSLKVKYYALKRKDIRPPSKEVPATVLLPSLSHSYKKYSGGGFTVLVAPSQNCISLDSNSK